MRVALLSPTYWPEVRRGSERVVHDLGVTLAARGHDVTVVTTHPGASAATEEEGMRVLRARRPRQPPGLRTHEYHLTGIPNAYLTLTSRPFDVAHCFFPSDAWAAVRARARGGPPVVASTHGVPTREYLVARRYRIEMQLEIARRAHEVSVLSEAAAIPYRRYLLREPVILPGGVLAGAFESAAEAPARPILFCAGSVGDPRKRAGLLFGAFERLRRDLPEAVLRVARSRDPFMSGAEPSLPEGAEWVDVAAPAALARAYGEATVTVNPAIAEAFGLVLIESLAAGTPVVADTSGAGPEIVENSSGRLFRPDDADDLARALAEAIALAGDAGTADACRRRAADFEWGRVVERYEDVYERVVRAS
jgi:glycosyltransferase involved in cell wall biosynthesis